MGLGVAGPTFLPWEQGCGHGGTGLGAQLAGMFTPPAAFHKNTTKKMTCYQWLVAFIPWIVQK